MISHHDKVNFHSPGTIASHFREAATARKGQWVINTWDWVETQPTCALASCMGGGPTKELVKTSVVLREKEYSRFAHLFTHGTRNGTKPATIHANMEQAAETFWPSGSLEHVALRLVAVVLVIRFLSGHEVSKSQCCCFTDRRYPTELRRCGGAVSTATAVGVQTSKTDADEPAVEAQEGTTSAVVPSGTQPHSSARQSPNDGGDNPVEVITVEEFLEEPQGHMPSLHAFLGESEPLPVPVGSPVTYSPIGTEVSEEAEYTDWATLNDPWYWMSSPTGFEQGVHGGNTPQDAWVLAEMRFDLGQRIVTVDHGTERAHLVVGQEFTKDTALNDHQQLVGTLVGPIPALPNIYKNSASNVKAGKEKRMDEKFRPFEPTKADVKKIRRLVGEATGMHPKRAIFSAKRIQRWAEEKLHLDQLVSGKWSAERTAASIQNMLQKAYPKMTFKVSIKAECMPEGKAPRILIADGDDGQLMALLVVKCFEDLLFDWMEDKSIKHAGKRDAIYRNIKSLTKKGARLIEGDGSAWDSTCRQGIRDLCENPIMRHIMQVLIPYGVVPEQWHAEHEACNTKAKLKLFFDSKMEKMSIWIEAIRRSGQRGTSCLNWWINFCNWICSIMEEPWLFLDPTKRNGKDVTGKMRWWNGAFEGDDSLCALFPPMIEGDELSNMFLDWWKRMGFNMKIVFADKRAEFCGWHIICVRGEPTGFAAPDLARAIKNAGVSVSGEAKRAALDGDFKTLRDNAASKSISYAFNFAGLYPTVSRKFHQYARNVKYSAEIKDRETSMQCTGEDGHGFTEIEQLIEGLNLAVTPTEELERLKLAGVEVSTEELDAWVLYSWDFQQLDDVGGYLASLPEAWRPAP